MKFRAVIRILMDHGFELDRQSGSHRQYIGKVDGRTKLVTLAFNSEGEDIPKKTLGSIIRQSGLGKHKFR